MNQCEDVRYRPALVALRKKIVSGQVSNREGGYNDAIRSAMSKLKELYGGESKLSENGKYYHAVGAMENKVRRGHTKEDQGFNEGIRDSIAIMEAYFG